jgi:hypothetical protein
METLQRSLVRGLRHRGRIAGLNFMGAARMVAVVVMMAMVVVVLAIMNE